MCLFISARYQSCVMFRITWFAFLWCRQWGYLAGPIIEGGSFERIPSDSLFLSSYSFPNPCFPIPVFLSRVFVLQDHPTLVYPFFPSHSRRSFSIDLSPQNSRCCLCNRCESVKLTPQVCNGPPASMNS